MSHFIIYITLVQDGRINKALRGTRTFVDAGRHLKIISFQFEISYPIFLIIVRPFYHSETMKTLKKILIPIDGSGPSRKAFSAAINITKSLQAEATVIYVIDTSVHLPPPFESMEVSTVVRLMEKEMKSMAESLLNEYVAKGKKEGIDISPKLAHGNIAKEIIKISSEYDLIIMGSVGQGTLMSILMGSVAEKVTRYADCSVMIVR